MCLSSFNSTPIYRCEQPLRMIRMSTCHLQCHQSYLSLFDQTNSSPLCTFRTFNTFNWNISSHLFMTENFSKIYMEIEPSSDISSTLFSPYLSPILLYFLTTQLGYELTISSLFYLQKTAYVATLDAKLADFCHQVDLTHFVRSTQCSLAYMSEFDLSTSHIRI